MDTAKLESVARALVQKGKGILAADESSGTIEKRFGSIQVKSTEPQPSFFTAACCSPPREWKLYQRGDPV